ncbi:MAG: LacI family DNA-binding transcriptional regulator [Actinomycetaceae bacterium]|nr:LacI family DNA-binding transcriptional regulator [Actinomycetaceae bacterium]
MTTNSSRALPTLEDVARAAGVSRATVSRVVRDDPTCTPHTREKVEKAIAEIGYVPNRLARSLVTRQTDAIAVVVAEPDERVFTDPFFATTIAGIAAALEPAEKHLSLLMGASRSSSYLERYLRGGYADAVILISHHRDDKLLSRLTALRIPCSLVGRPMESSQETRFADIDNELGGYLATQHLVERGCQRIASITGPMTMAAAADRKSGYYRALAEAGLQSVGEYDGGFTAEIAQIQASRLLEEHPEVDGIFISSDLMAAGAIPVLNERGRTVPDHVAVVGFDDSRLSKLTTPALTTVTNPGHDLGFEAAQIVLSQLKNESLEGPTIITPQLVVRQSA